VLRAAALGRLELRGFQPGHGSAKLVLVEIAAGAQLVV